MTLREQVIRAIETSGVSLYRLAQEAGMGRGSLGRFVSGEQDMTLDRAQKLLVALGLVIRMEKK